MWRPHCSRPAWPSRFTRRPTTSLGNESPRLGGQAHRGIAPYQVFPSEDGYVTIAAGQQNFYEAFCRLAGIAGLISNVRFATVPDRVNNADTLVELISVATRKHSSQWWINELDRLRIPCGPVLTQAEVMTHPTDAGAPNGRDGSTPPSWDR